MSEPTQEMALRRTSKIELGLVIGFLLNFGAAVWVAAVFATKLQTVIIEMGAIKTELTDQRNQAPTTAVLRYRVEQLEAAVRRLETRR